MKNVIAIFGGDSCEHDISIITGVEAICAAPIKGYKIIPIYVKHSNWYTDNGLFDLKNLINFNPANFRKVGVMHNYLYELKSLRKLVKICKIDCALILAHGGEGESGQWQGFFETNNIPYTTCDMLSSAICMDKIYCKEILKSYGFSVIEGYEIDAWASNSEIEDIIAKLKFPIVVKPTAQGSSIGVSYVKSINEINIAIELSRKFGSRVLLEKGLTDYLELNQAALIRSNSIILSKIESPVSSGEILSFNDKYNKGACSKCELKKRTTTNAPLIKQLTELVSTTSNLICKKLNLFGIVRFDYLYADGKLYLNEINTIPGSLAHYLFENISYSKLISILIEEAINRIQPKQNAFSTNVLHNLKSVSK
ncbi:MAG: hypothetical protein LBF12_03740 [Christensenellaceae bacterium]|jgi:D-alanine-D-alanine ligase|nr:hypothetical protein [Christensenellaceae bacterium]